MCQGELLWQCAGLASLHLVGLRAWTRSSDLAASTFATEQIEPVPLNYCQLNLNSKVAGSLSHYRGVEPMTLYTWTMRKWLIFNMEESEGQWKEVPIDKGWVRHFLCWGMHPPRLKSCVCVSVCCQGNLLEWEAQRKLVTVKSVPSQCPLHCSWGYTDSLCPGS